MSEALKTSYTEITPGPEQGGADYNIQLQSLKERLADDAIPSVDAVLDGQELLARIEADTVAGDDQLIDRQNKLIDRSLYEDIKQATSEDVWFDPDQVDKKIRIKDATKLKDLPQGEERNAFKSYWRINHPQKESAEAFSEYRQEAKKWVATSEAAATYYDALSSGVPAEEAREIARQTAHATNVEPQAEDQAPDMPLTEQTDSVEEPKTEHSNASNTRVSAPSPRTMPKRTNLVGQGRVQTPSPTIKQSQDTKKDQAPTVSAETGESQEDTGEYDKDFRGKNNRSENHARSTIDTGEFPALETARPANRSRRSSSEAPAEVTTSARTTKEPDSRAAQQAAAKAANVELQKRLAENPKLLEGLMDKDARGKYVRPNGRNASAAELLQVIENREQILNALTLVVAPKKTKAVEQRIRRRAKTGVVLVKQAAAPDVTPFEPAEENPHKVSIDFVPDYKQSAFHGRRASSGIEPVDPAYEPIVHTADTPADTSGEAIKDTLPTEEILAERVAAGMRVATARRPSKKHASIEPRTEPIPAVTGYEYPEYPQAAADREAAGMPEESRSRVKDVFKTIGWSLRHPTAAVGMLMAEAQNQHEYSNAEAGAENQTRRKNLLALAVGAAVLGGKGYLLYKGMAGGGSSSTAEQAADAVANTGAPAPEVPPAPAPAPEPPLPATGQLESAGDTISEDIQDIFEAHGEGDNIAEINEATRRAMAASGKTDATARTMQIGETYTHGDYSDLLPQAFQQEAVPTEVPLETQAASITVTPEAIPAELPPVLTAEQIRQQEIMNDIDWRYYGVAGAAIAAYVGGGLARDFVHDRWAKYLAEEDKKKLKKKKS